MKKELAVLMRPQVLSALLTTVLGAGAMFTLYAYISPVLQNIARDAGIDHGNAGADWCRFSMVAILAANWQIVSVNGTLKGFLLLLMVIMLAIPLTGAQ